HHDVGGQSRPAQRRGHDVAELPDRQSVELRLGARARLFRRRVKTFGQIAVEIVGVRFREARAHCPDRTRHIVRAAGGEPAVTPAEVPPLTQGDLVPHVARWNASALRRRKAGWYEAECNWEGRGPNVGAQLLVDLP